MRCPETACGRKQQGEEISQYESILVRQSETEGVCCWRRSRWPRGHSPAVQVDSRTPAARNAVFSRHRAASAWAAVRRRGFAAGGGGFLATPVLRLSLSNLREDLAEAGAARREHYGSVSVSNLVAAELAIAMVLLGSAGLLSKSLYRMFHVDLNFNPANLATRRSTCLAPDTKRPINCGRFPSGSWSTSRPCRGWFPSPIPAICPSRAIAIRRISGCWGIRGTESTIRPCGGRRARITSRHCRPG